jgi:hypothetical protein
MSHLQALTDRTGEELVKKWFGCIIRAGVRQIRVLLEKLTVTQLVKKFPAFYGI